METSAQCTAEVKEATKPFSCIRNGRGIIMVKSLVPFSKSAGQPHLDTVCIAEKTTAENREKEPK